LDNPEYPDIKERTLSNEKLTDWFGGEYVDKTPNEGTVIKDSRINFGHLADDPEENKRIFKEIDTGDDGTVSWVEFKTWIGAKLGLENTAETPPIVEDFHENFANGGVSLEDLPKLFAEYADKVGWCC
jgi:hypothetical protein